MTSKPLAVSTIVCRLCSNRCYGPMDTGHWPIGHKTTCRGARIGATR